MSHCNQSLESDNEEKEPLKTRMKDLDVMMESTAKQLEGKIDASYSRLVSKMDELNRCLKAMFRKLVGMKASNTN